MDISYYQHAVNPHITPAKARTDLNNDIVILMSASQKLVPNDMKSRLGDLKTETKRKKPASQQVNVNVKDSYKNEAVHIDAKNVSINSNGSIFFSFFTFFFFFSSKANQITQGKTKRS